MKQKIFILLLFSATLAAAQDSPQPKDPDAGKYHTETQTDTQHNDEIIYELSKVDTPPVFADGKLTFEDYINWKINPANLSGLKPGLYDVSMEIVMDNSGVMTYFTADSGHDSLSKEVVRTTRRAPQWNPARRNGKKVAVRMNISIKVTVSKL